MAFNNTCTAIELGELMDVCARKHAQGYRFVQMLCTVADPGIDLVYSFMKRDEAGVYQLEDYLIAGLDRQTQTVPSVTGYYLSAFPFENEAHDLFGVKVEGNAIDFAGRFYQVAMDTPMTVISPAQQAAREKAARIAAAKAAKEAKEKAAGAAEASGASARPAAPALDIEAERAKMEERLAGMEPEKAAKVRAAFEAKMAKRAAEAAQAADAAAVPDAGGDAQAKQAALEERLAGLDPEKAARVRAAMEAKAAREAAQKGGE